MSNHADGAFGTLFTQRPGLLVVLAFPRLAYPGNYVLHQTLAFQELYTLQNSVMWPLLGTSSVVRQGTSDRP